MKYKRVNRYTLVTEDGNYSIRKNHATGSYYIKDNRLHEYVTSASGMRIGFARQRSAKEFIERNML